MKTIRSILLQMKKTVEQEQTQSPNWWIDRAIELNVLWQDLKQEMTKYEMLYKSEVVELIEKGNKISQAERTVEASSENYSTYQYLKGRDKIIEEFIKLAKKRATIESTI